MPNKILIILFLIFSPQFVCLSYGEAEYEKYFNEGRTAYGNGEYHAAIEQLQKSYRLKPNSYSAYYLAFSFEAIGNRFMAYTYAVEAYEGKPRLKGKMNDAILSLLGKYKTSAICAFAKSAINSIAYSEKLSERYVFSEGNISPKDVRILMDSEERDKKEITTTIFDKFKEKISFLKLIGASDTEIEDAIEQEYIFYQIQNSYEKTPEGIDKFVLKTWDVKAEGE